MHVRHAVVALLTCLALCAQSTLAAGPGADARTIERGRYLVRTSGCNDCHTPGYAEASGKLPEEAWLTGSPVGFQGPWGTSYPANLRLAAHAMNEAQWVARARQPMRPPMPWFSLRDMTDADLIAMYRFIRSLGPAGTAAPVAGTPGSPVDTPYFEFVPKNLPKQASR